jgi:hypothetical protein
MRMRGDLTKNSRELLSVKTKLARGRLTRVVVSGARSAVEGVAEQVVGEGDVLVEAGVELADKPGRRLMVAGASPYDPRITLLADLGESAALPEQEFDGIVLVDALRQSGYRSAIANVHAALRPTGIMVAYVPAQRLKEVSRTFGPFKYERRVPFPVVVARRG